MSYARSPRAVCSTTIGTSVPAYDDVALIRRPVLALALSKSRVLSSRMRARERGQIAFLLHAARAPPPSASSCARRSARPRRRPRRRGPRRPRGARSRRAGCRPWPPSRDSSRCASRYCFQSTPTLRGVDALHGQAAGGVLGARRHVALDQRLRHLEGGALARGRPRARPSPRGRSRARRRPAAARGRRRAAPARLPKSPRSLANSSSAAGTHLLLHAPSAVSV